MTIFNRQAIRRKLGYLKIFSKAASRTRPYLRWWQFDTFGSRLALYPNVRINILGRLTIGDNVCIRRNCVLTGTGNLTIGSGTSINQSVLITAMKSIHIGCNCMVAPNVFILDVSHRFTERTVPMKDQGCNTAPVVIEDDVWIGTGCIVLQGVRIGAGAVLAANSVINSDVAPYTVVGGSPAKLLRNRP